MTRSSRFATKEEIFSSEFDAINKRVIEINKAHALSDHSEINAERFPWSKEKYARPSVYASRLWEYPFAVLSADLKPGMQVADVGCGTSPFTIYLAEASGKNCVTGFDPDEIIEGSRHSMFGANRSLLNSLGINYSRSGFSGLDAKSESFDRVFCISVLEHIDDPMIRQKGISEMVRILKPGGRLIITFDTGIDVPLANPMDIVKYSGLTICGTLNNEWPEERFLKIDSSNLDVFGLVLEKKDNSIFRDYDKTKTIQQYMANNNFIPEVMDSNQIQIGKDLRKSYGMLRVIAKLMLGKYKA